MSQATSDQEALREIEEQISKASKVCHDMWLSGSQVNAELLTLIQAAHWMLVDITGTREG